MTPELREACRRALHVLTADGTLLRSGRAALFVLERTTPPWRLFARVFRHPPLSWFVEIGYQIVARNRSLLARVVARGP
jgi:predicted DCC family thiol-disulfide oxidoreductase YuxK